MNEQDVFSFSATCIKNYPGAKFTRGKTYLLKYNRTNDIVFYKVSDDNYNSIMVSEFSWTHYFEKHKI